MTLSKEEIFKILEENPNKELINEAVKRNSLLNMHVNGVGVKEHLSSLKEHESDIQADIGERIIESNKGIYNALLHPTSKVFSAKGGSRSYDVPSNRSNYFKNIVSNTAHGLSLRKWLEKRIFNKYITDPNGIIFIEVFENEATPTFKSITSIYDYKVVGQKVEYIVFKPQKIDDTDKKYYRVVDDSFDYYIEVEKKDKKYSYVINEGKTYPIHFNNCPGFVVSDIFDNTHNIKASFIEPTLEKANTFLYDNSIHSKHKLLFGFAKYWELGRDCIVCNGTGHVTGENGQEECSSCNGTGMRAFGSVSDKLIFPAPTHKDDFVPKKFAGYDSPDLEIWKQYKEDLKDHEKDLFRILWNINYISEQKTKTATQSSLEVQPINDRLHPITDNFEKLEQFVTDCLGQFYLENNYKGSSINYGRRYLLESPDVIWNKLAKAKKDKMPTVFLINLTKEYIQSLYINNELESSLHLKLLSLEPFLFMTIDEVLKLNIDLLEKKRKIYFQEWLQTKKEPELLLKSKEALEYDLKQFLNTKTFTNETPEVSGIEQGG